VQVLNKKETKVSGWDSQQINWLHKILSSIILGSGIWGNPKSAGLRLKIG
jgi:hypothetical protein